MRIRHPLFRRSLLASALAAALLAQPLAAQTTSAAPSEMVTMNMRDADIRTLIQWIADQTGKNMIVHRDVQGKVNVLSAKPVTREEAYRIFLSVLQVHGFAAIETPEAVKIVPASIATQGGLPQRSSETDDMIVQVFRVNNVAATEIAQMLKPLASKEAVINADASTNMLLVADHAGNVEQLQNLVQKLDRAGASEVELVHLEHANAKQVLTSLSGLFANQGGGNAGGMPGQTNNLPLNLSADERSNSILLSGDAGKRAQVRRLIQQMDTEISGSGNTQVLYLQYASAKEIVPILKSIAQSVLKDQKDKETSFSIDASESANAVVINAPPGLSDSLKNVVQKLDVRRAQVLVEALIVEVSSDITNDIGVIWGSTNINDLNGSGGVAGVNALGKLDLIGTAKGLDSTGAITDIAAPGGGLTLGYYTGGNLQAAIRALSANTKANIISTPTIVAIDNEEASLLVGQNVPLKTGQQTSAASSTSNPFVTIERKDIGTSLHITPRINQGNTLTLDLKQKVESVTDSVSGASDIVTNKREIDTKVLMRDDQILVLGGLISDEQTGSKQKVPILGDLPLIGRLFSSDSTEHKKNNLMVFIHPVILRDDERARQVSQQNYEYMQHVQEKSQQPPPSTTEKNPPPPAKLQDFDTFSPVRAKP
ncbi:MAG TPA: type II secretion system secretin GspD [Spongiibacteraceae bacterium]|nr:type II secretion system secretin GspD [Spongiibacteraceae bacterium]